MCRSVITVTFILFARAFSLNETPLGKQFMVIIIFYFVFGSSIEEKLFLVLTRDTVELLFQQPQYL